MKRSILLFVVATVWAQQHSTVEPTYLKRRLPDARSVAGKTCVVTPLFGEGGTEARVARGVARYAEIRVNGGQPCAAGAPVNEEQVAVVLEGAGGIDYAGKQVPLKAHDFLYLPPGLQRSFAGSMRLVLMGFRIPQGLKAEQPEQPLIANWDDVQLQQVGSHPPSTLYRLMMGDTTSKRDRLAAGHVLTSLYIMEFAPGGTNAPHHHDAEEEIYLLLSGKGEMVAGGGVDGTENLLAAEPGDAFFFRLNCTVGFYSAKDPGNKAVILAVRSLYPRRGR